MQHIFDSPADGTMATYCGITAYSEMRTDRRAAGGDVALAPREAGKPEKEKRWTKKRWTSQILRKVKLNPGGA